MNKSVSEELEKLQLAIWILANAIEDGRISGVVEDIRDVLGVEFYKEKK